MFHNKQINISIHCGVMVSVLASGAVDRGLNLDYKIGICYFSAKHAALRRKSRVCLTGDQDNVSELCDISIRGLLFQ